MTTQTAYETFTLEYLKTIGIVNNGFNGRGFANPYDLAVVQDGRIFVLNRCDPARRTAIRIGILNLNEDYLGEFGYGYGDGDGQFVWPVAMALDSSERIYVTDEYNHRVTVFDTGGSFLTKWGTLGNCNGQINGPAGIALDSDDNVYVVDQHNSRIQKFTPEGSYLSQWGHYGAGDGEFNLPWGVTLDTEGHVYVADWRNDRIQKFTSTGRFLTSFGKPGEGEGHLHRPSSVAVDPEGYIYVADWGNERVQVFGPDGSVQVTLKGQATLSKWAKEYLEVNPEEKEARDTSNLIPTLPHHLNAPHLISSQIEPYFWGPISVRLDTEGRLYVTETNRHRIQVYQKK